MDRIEAGISGCLFPSLGLAALTWWLWDRSPGWARAVGVVAAVGLVYGSVSFVLMLRRSARDRAE
jgi:hypothetical protein